MNSACGKRAPIGITRTPSSRSSAACMAASSCSRAGRKRAPTAMWSRCSRTGRTKLPAKSCARCGAGAIGIRCAKAPRKASSVRRSTARSAHTSSASGCECRRWISRMWLTTNSCSTAHPSARSTRGPARRCASASSTPPPRLTFTSAGRAGRCASSPLTGRTWSR